MLLPGIKFPTHAIKSPSNRKKSKKYHKITKHLYNNIIKAPEMFRKDHKITTKNHKTSLSQGFPQQLPTPSAHTLVKSSGVSSNSSSCARAASAGNRVRGPCAPSEAVARVGWVFHQHLPSGKLT